MSDLTLIDDIRLLARSVRSSVVFPDTGAFVLFENGVLGAADRILSADAHGGLPAAILRQAAGRLESRLVHLLREEVQAIVGGGVP